MIDQADYAIFRFTGAPISTHSYLFVDPKTRNALAVDAVLASASAFFEYSHQNNINLDEVIDTHGHWDHILDNHVYLKAGTPLWIHAADEAMIAMDQGKMLGLGLNFVPTQATAKIQEGDQIKVGHFVFTVLHTPGHTPGGICLYEKSLKLLFSGDTLFAGTYGRTDFPGGNVQLMQASLRRLGELPDDVTVFPGHGEATSIGAEAWIRNPQI